MQILPTVGKGDDCCLRFDPEGGNGQLVVSHTAVWKCKT